ncbi:GNAT family N-acetyltransferase [Streptomyces sp. NPDC058221]|uniref:GNAT family N-acetyltransferase n=1 Tax=Streptomyces sp. NPDC058221 TaxID=3346388 RepID=UPI0036EDBF86
MTAHPVIRGLTAADWGGILALEREAYAPLGLSEDQAVLRSKAAASPGTCFVLRTEEATVGGYLLALPSPPRLPPTWGRAEGGRVVSENLHIHDLVVSPLLRGRGLARRLVGHLEDAARGRGHTSVSLVAVGGADRFWAARGYSAEPLVAVTDYDAAAVYMSRSLRPQGRLPGLHNTPVLSPPHSRS